ncbi:RluA family pseudouridine synthase [Marinicrinis sediminis]|uniref:Pseudouridine synthase n=1 Tax=Marinicrinis sediminis TaxID=1652465 RepID=A0ABW5R9M5_9BACL
MNSRYYPPIVYQISEQEEGWSVKAILHHKMNLSRKLVSRLKYTEQGITLNGRRVWTNTKVTAGDTVEIRMVKEQSDDILPQPIPLDILYEDDSLLMVNKQAGIIVHPTLGHYKDTLANGVVHYWQQKGESYRFRPVHRLDQDTSGVICIAKNPYVQQAIQEQMHAFTVHKQYLAVVRGRLPRPHGTIDAPIERDPENPHYRMVIAEGARAVTRYKVHQASEEASLVQLQLETGRTHQIRVHMAHLGHPLIGDPLYGDPDLNLRYEIDRQALHAAELGFEHPVTKEPLLFQAPLPADMRELLDRLSFTISD